MNAENLTVKDQYDSCKGSECPRLRELCTRTEDGRYMIAEGSMAYTAMVVCNNWAILGTDGNCPIRPAESEA